MEAYESPVSNHETGSLTQREGHESRFVGSSSGVYFINTVKQAFESSAQTCSSAWLPPAEDTVGGEDDFRAPGHDPSLPSDALSLNLNSTHIIEGTTRARLGPLPSYEHARRCAIAYFEVWHPVLPFLSGPEFLHELDAMYPAHVEGMAMDRHRQCYLIIFSCVLTMGASASHDGLSTPHMPSGSALLSLIASLAFKHDLLTIQTVLAAQVYCISTMALRTASLLGGMLSKLLYHAGFHRCPHRYPQLSSEDCELRKRILWSSYAVDRYVCQALGMPVALPDAEIDVCVPGRREKHGILTSSNLGSDNPPAELSEAGTGVSLCKELVLANFVDYSSLVGQALEIFHQSIHTRNKDPRKVLFLRGDVEKWYNNLPEASSLSPGSSASEAQIARCMPFFQVLYEQLVIAVHRPSLSLPRSAPEFHHGLQTNIRAAKKTIAALERQSHLFWPGYLAAVWMSGLIISFACQIRLYSVAQGSQEIQRCLALLQRMSDHWQGARRCQAALSTLLAELSRNVSEDAEGENSIRGASKRPRLDPVLSSSKEHTISGGRQSEGAPRNMEAPTYAFDDRPASPTSWDIDVDDFFHDLSWNNLFDYNDLLQGNNDPFAGD